MMVLRVALDDVPEYCRPEYGAVTKSQQHIMRNCFNPVFEWQGNVLTSSFFAEWSWDGKLFRGRVNSVRFHTGQIVTSEIIGQIIHRKFRSLNISHRINCDNEFLTFEIDHVFGPLLSVLAEEDVLVTDGNGAGTGPYRITMWERGYVQLAKVPSMAESKFPDIVQFISYKSAEVILDALLSGEIDLAYEIPYRVLREGHPHLCVTVAPIRSMNSLQFNCQRIPTPVRRRIRDAIDLAAILNSVHEGVGIVPNGLFPSDTLGYTPSSNRSLETSNRSLENHDSADLSGSYPNDLELITRPAPIAVERWATAIAMPLQGLGIHVRITALSVGETVARMQRGDFDMAQLGFQIGPDPYAFLLEFFSREGTMNLTRFYSPEFEQLLEAARNTVREEARSLLYAKMQSIIRDEVPVIPTRQGYSMVISSATHPIPLDPNADGIIIVARGRWA